jgi:hypothetical protein
MGLGTVLWIIGLGYRAWQWGLSFDGFVKVTLVAFALGASVGYVFLPTFWVAWNLYLYGGTVEQHLLPGASIGNLMTGAVVGGLITLGWAIRSYFANIFD